MAAPLYTAIPFPKQGDGLASAMQSQVFPEQSRSIHKLQASCVF